MAKSKKLADPSLKVIHHPLAQTLSIHSSISDTIKTPALASALSDLLKHSDVKTQKQALKSISSNLPKDEACRSPLAKLFIAFYLDFAFASLKVQIAQILISLSTPCIDFLKAPKNRSSLLFNSEIPLTHTEHLFSCYLELMQKFSLPIPREEHSRILSFIVCKVEAERQQQVKGETYSVGSMSSMSACLTFLSTFVPKWIPEVSEADQAPLKTLANCTSELAKEELVDRDILTLAGINYWLAANLLIRNQIGDYPADTECDYLNTMLSKGKLNLEDIKGEVLVKKVERVEETANKLCIVRGFTRVMKDLGNLYKPCVGKKSYMEYIPVSYTHLTLPTICSV
eukprot:TRINITY_DN13067_c0_g1_i3.p1 TRINITY_DN13067_c0_g1~~TRINITY_DN13067_c0_g1_i3.p1  ORF type:complete len:342 (-),score=43.68 TRINITY_DN13067_c0_g1_i3:40-1065(-)